jgi:hypothetical protein
MSFINVDEVNQDIQMTGFVPLLDKEYPCCLIGFQIKNHYDQLRLKFDSKYATSDIIHFLHYPEVTPLFFRGVFLNLSSNLTNLIKELEDITLKLNVDQEAYKKVLKQYNLSCTFNLDLLSSGVYPIDGECVSLISDTCKIDLKDMYNSLFHNDFAPYFQSIGYISIFILSNKNLANSNNSKVLESITNHYKDQTL